MSFNLRTYHVSNLCFVRQFLIIVSGNTNICMRETNLIILEFRKNIKLFSCLKINCTENRIFVNIHLPVACYISKAHYD